MNLEKMLEEYRKGTEAVPREEKIAQTVRLSGETFFQMEQERVLSYAEFLKTQFLVLRKRWWVYQCLLLTGAGILLGNMQEGRYMRRSVGVVSVLFVVLIIPEMWKNRTHLSMEVETAAYYSLRQIYAARMMMFGAVDIFLTAAFCLGLKGQFHYTASELLVQFLFPMVVTACICFGALCSKYAMNEAVSVAFCLVWSGVWWLVTMNERIYRSALLPVWVCLFLAAAAVMTVCAYRAVKFCGQCLEVGDGAQMDGSEIG